MVKKAIGGYCLVVIITIFAAQNAKNEPRQRAKPDLSGTWILDLYKSTLSKSETESLTDYVLTIMHHEPEIRITKREKNNGRESLEEWVYYTDGRPETLPGGSPQKTEVLTKWRNQKLFRRISYTLQIPFESIPDQTVLEEEWGLSEDGKILTRTVRKSRLTSHPGRGRSGSNEPSTEKYVLRRG